VLRGTGILYIWRGGVVYGALMLGPHKQGFHVRGGGGRGLSSFFLGPGGGRRPLWPFRQEGRAWLRLASAVLFWERIPVARLFWPC
jgi:hypothetical protein